MSKFAKLARSVTRNKSVLLNQPTVDKRTDRPSQLATVSIIINNGCSEYSIDVSLCQAI